MLAVYAAHDASNGFLALSRHSLGNDDFDRNYLP